MKKNNKGFIATSILFGIVALLFITFAIILGNSHASLKSDKMYGNMLKGEITNFLGIKLYPNGGYLAQTKLEIDFNGTYGGKDENGNLKELPVPTRNGYTFVGWRTEKDSGQFVQAGTRYEEVKANRLYAFWEKNIYTLTINPNGGTYKVGDNDYVSSFNMNLSYEELVELEIPTRVGYIFSGWELSGDGSKVAGNTFQMGYTGATLVAKWDIKKVKLTVDPNFGTWEDSIDVSIFELDYLTSREIEEPVRDGYTFVGWEYDKDKLEFNGNVVTIKSEDALLKAKWQIKNYPYIVKHYQQGIYNDEYTLIDADTTEGVAEFGTVVRPPYNTYAGFQVQGDIAELTITSNTDNNLVEYQYARILYLLKIDPNTGVYNGNLEEYHRYGKSVSLAVPTKAGYTFAGWTVPSGTLKDNIYTISDSDVTLTANWVATDYVITLETNGGIITKPTVTVTYDNTYGNLEKPVRTGYTFKGWSTTSDGKNIINENTIVKTASDHKLYAVWEANTYTVTLYLRGGISNTTSITVTYGDAYDELPTPTKDKHRFLGWFTDETIGTEVKNDTKVTTADDHNLYARWLPTDAEFVQYSNPTYTTCDNVACTLNELYQMLK